MLQGEQLCSGIYVSLYSSGRMLSSKVEKNSVESSFKLHNFNKLGQKGLV